MRIHAATVFDRAFCRHIELFFRCLRNPMHRLRHRMLPGLQGSNSWMLLPPA
jgi:hypothetical protein